MRIIAGKFRRRKLLSNPGLVTRPIIDRVKESLFENVSQRLIGRRVADIFAGTGTIGLEALSRGADCVTFLERDRVAVELLRKNLQTLDCESDTIVWPVDVLRCSFRPKGPRAPRFTPFDVIFFDPPYAMVPKMVAGSPLWLALQRLTRPSVTSAGATLVLRVPERANYDLPSAWQVDWSLSMANMEVHVCTLHRSEQTDSLEMDTEEPALD